jgi:hypothetical protein
LRIYTFILALTTVLPFGCATAQYTKAHGDVGQFILQQAVDYGGIPSVTNGLPVVASSWRYKEDAYGMVISLSQLHC